MNHTLKEELVEVFRKNGADLVRFGNVERFENEAVREIFPGTKTVIGAAFRVLRGARRGIEEGSTYYQYTTNGVETMEETIMPMALLRACAVLEDHGFEALPLRRNQTIMEEENSTNPEVDFNDIYRGKTAEKQLDFEACAVLCGLGERGLSGTLLTDDFGPFQRYVFVLTDAEIEPDPIVEPHLCDHCGECVKACPGHALSKEGKLDRWQCAAYYIGANMHYNPFMPAEFLRDHRRRSAAHTGTGTRGNEAHHLLPADETQLPGEHLRKGVRHRLLHPSGAERGAQAQVPYAVPQARSVETVAALRAEIVQPQASRLHMAP